MATSYAYPYRVLPDAVTVEVLSSTPAVPQDGHRFDLRELTESTGATFHLKLKCCIDPTAVGTVLPSGVALEDAILLGVREIGVGAQLRKIHVGGTGDVDVTFELSFEVDRYWGKVELDPVLILATDVVPGPATARAAGSVLSWGPAITLLFDTAEPFSAGGMLEVEWRNFDEDPDLPNEALHALETDLRPKLLLNSHSAAAFDILRSEATHGAKARIRDLTFAGIAAQVWTTLIRAAYSALRAEAATKPDVEPTELLDELGDWQRSVLEAWAPALLGEDDPESAVRALCATAIDDEHDPLLRLDRVLQTQLNPRRCFEKLAEDALGG